MSEKRNTEPKKAKSGKTQPKKKSTTKARKNPLQEKLNAAGQEIETLKDQVLRTAAELDNFRKRTEKEISQILQNANEGLIIDLLPIIDDLERSLKSAPEQSTDKDFFKGVEMIHQKLMTLLKSNGVEPLESVGKEFDVDHHDALLQVEHQDTPSGMVVEEHERGYAMNGKVIRHAKVLVSK